MAHAGIKAEAKPKRRDRHYPYDENVNEGDKLIEDEPVDIQSDISSEEKRPIENLETEDTPEPPIFEE